MRLSRLLLCALALFSISGTGHAQQTQASTAWSRLIGPDKPVLRWSFDGQDPLQVLSSENGTLDVRIDGRVSTGKPGPNRTTSRLFRTGNRAVEFFGSGGAIKVKDPGENSVLDFTKGDAITIEAWVRPRSVSNGGYMYVVGKGRTNNAGFASGNQSYALRLQGKGGEAVLSWLFRNGEDKVTSGSDFHRWTSSDGFPVDDKWHHIALSYEFGKADSLKGFVDGDPVDGVWDMKGKTSKGPLVDNDELWIGSSMGMQSGSTFNGFIDEVAIYRNVISADRMLARVPIVRRPSPPPMPESAPPRDRVLVETLEGISDKVGWPTQLPQASEHWTEPAFAFFRIPERYTSKGIRVDRANPLILRASSLMTLPAGKYRFLLRTLRYGRLYLDGKLVLETPARSHRPNAHGRMFNLKSQLAPETRALYPGAEERLAEIELDGNEHEFRLLIHMGGQKRRLELGETSLSIARIDEAFRVLSLTEDIPLTDSGWESYEARRRDEYVWIDQQRRRSASRNEDRYWTRRHAAARNVVAGFKQVEIPDIENSASVNNPVDVFIQARLEAEEVAPAALTDDWAFLRRASLDVIGTPPSEEMIREFFADDRPDRRTHFIDRLLEHPGWADQWVGYWQDVLAENPNVVNPTLNNTGPFRWWIYESFLDNKPIDRFATELIQMEGSSHFGGPGGFELATQNDAPFAAKAHIIGQAFLALEMKCARCHDAPYHDFKQSDLFSLAAMLKRSPQGVPKTSSLPAGESNSELVTVSLKPGESAPVAWPFESSIQGSVPDELTMRDQDSRQELAARVTSPRNERFAQVIANRLWHRWLGRGLVEPVDDWQDAEPSHPRLLDWLGRELASNGYDLKHLARVILNSHTYQRVVVTLDDPAQVELFATPRRRRLSAEQLVDSIFVLSGKPFRAGDMNIDVDGSRALTSSLNLGIPRRAWMFSSLSNERDRPSLSLPYAQPFVTTLKTFGWRESRQNPLTVREEEPTVLQPAIVANGTLARRFTRLSDDNDFTALALQNRPVADLVESVFARTLTRRPTSEERELFVELLSDGYGERINREALNRPPAKPLGARSGVGWSNHLQPKANEVQVALQELVRNGDPPTEKLQTEWREAFEDTLWVLINSPEFMFVP